MTNIHKLSLAIDIAKDIDTLSECDMMAVSYRITIPASYVFIKDIIVHNYRVSIYDMNLIGKASFLLNIANLGMFQTM
jgi:hypothetical protein